MESTSTFFTEQDDEELLIEMQRIEEDRQNVGTILMMDQPPKRGLQPIRGPDTKKFVPLPLTGTEKSPIDNK